MKTRIAVLAACIAAVIALSLIGAPRAEALQAGRVASAPSVSLPYIEDVNPSGKSAYVAVVSCAGKAKRVELKVVDVRAKKRVKVHRISGKRFEVKIRKGRSYKLSVRAKGGAWKSTGYRVY